MSDVRPPPVVPRDAAIAQAHARHATVGTLQSLGAGLAILPAGLVSAALLTRALGPQGYGLIALTVAVASWVQIAVVVGLDRTAIRLVAVPDGWEAAATRLVQVQLALALAGASALAAAAGPIAAAMGRPELAPLLRIAALDTVLLATFGIHGSILTGRGAFGQRATTTIAYWSARLAGVVVVFWLAPTVRAAVFAMVAASAIGLFVVRRFAHPPVFRRTDYPLSRIWVYAWPLFFYTVAAAVFGNVDLLLVGSLDPDPDASGYFGAVKNLTIVPSTFAGAVAPLLLAKLTEMSARDEREAARAMAVRALRVALCMLPFAAMSAGAAPEIVTLVYGGRFAPAAPLLVPLIFAAVAGSVSMIAASLLIAAGRPGRTVWLAAPVTVAAVAALAVVVPRYGALGAAHVTHALSWGGALWAVLLVQSRWPMGALVRSALRCALCCAPAWWIAAAWPTPGLWLIVKLGLISAVIVASLIVTREVNRSDRDFVRSLVPRTNPARPSSPRSGPSGGPGSTTS